MNDPRKEATWKQRRHEDRVLLLLGAILDALFVYGEPSSTCEKPVGLIPSSKPPRTRKQDA